MSKAENLKKIIEQVNDLAQQGDDKEALKLLNRHLARATDREDATSIRILSRHGMVIAEHCDNVDQVRKYSEQLLSYSPKDPFPVYALAEVLLRKGEREEAKRLASQAYELSIQRGTKEDESLVQLILKRWPELKRG